MFRRKRTLFVSTQRIISFRNTTSGAGEQFLPQDCRAKADRRGLRFFTDTGITITVTIATMVSFHNFKSQNFKLSVSNPKSKYVAYLSVLSQISNCQSLGRKNKYEILKTDRTILPPPGLRGVPLGLQNSCREHPLPPPRGSVAAGTCVDAYDLPLQKGALGTSLG